MTAEQFKAWFDGFCEGIDGVPTADQWQKLRGKVAELQSAPQYKPYTGLRDGMTYPRERDNGSDVAVVASGELVKVWSANNAGWSS